MIFTLLPFGHGRHATSSAAAKPHNEPSTASRIFIAASRSCAAVPRTILTEQEACVSTPSATEPSRNRLNPPNPREPRTIRSAFHEEASSRITSRASPMIISLSISNNSSFSDRRRVNALVIDVLAYSIPALSIREWSLWGSDLVSSVGIKGSLNAEMTLTTLPLGQGCVAISLTAASLEMDPSIANKIFILVLHSKSSDQSRSDSLGDSIQKSNKNMSETRDVSSG